MRRFCESTKGKADRILVGERLGQSFIFFKILTLTSYPFLLQGLFR